MTTTTWTNATQLRRDWFSNVSRDLLAGAVVALALIPEAIAFSIIAGVDPKVGLYASFIIAVVTAFVGGRPGLISAATGAMALLMVYLVKDYGVQYLFAATILTGMLQVIFGLLKLGKQMKFVPRAVMVGFVNALAILIFMAQLPQLSGASWVVYAMMATGLGIIYLLPRLTQLVPSPLVAIVVLTGASMTLGLDVPTVGDMGELPTTPPGLMLPQVPLTLETLQIIFPVSATLAIVGLLESLLTASLVDELTDTPSDKNQEAKGQGIANIITGFFGGMAGCAMIGQSVINIQSGGRKRLSTLAAGVFLLFFILVLGHWVSQIPMAALVAVMIMVSIGTFNWSSIKNIRRVPRSETAVMVTTVVITVVSHNLAIGVVIGIALSTVFFSRKIAQVVFVDTVLSSDGSERTYKVAGQLFFVSVEEFLSAFDFEEELERVTVDLSHAHVWDQAAVNAIDKVVLKFRRHGADVELLGVNEASQSLLNRLAIHNEPDALEKLANH
ncbi:sodium-independent anion transporter [Halomicronema hongdechloris C2206]|uniref:Sodium-independent anion transporter n=1 Tax=Halomicronema hongdechloris C2206 TaxID=1641165 RepID=A0A1Z3HPK0_9CYAN|nr:SulP family inorganic anion transporter [Halomicronema hongdechloris]ASC72228.1 sodium-independent anion transporter [Halomicronema hongdechloris C2206]